MKDPTLWVIAGSTGTGKTAYSLRLAERIKNQNPNNKPHIVNADSMQLYRGMNIGTAKVSKKEMSQVPHHLFDVLNVQDEATVAWYQPVARTLIKDLLEAGSDVILVGGSGLYVSSVIYNFDFPSRDSALREKLNNIFNTEGIEPLLAQLKKLSPNVYEQVDKNNPRRVIRALELAESGETAQTKLPEKPTLWYPNTKIIGLFVERNQLVKGLDARVVKMWESGLLDEVKSLLPAGIENSPTASRAIGYQQAISVLNNEMSEVEAITKTQILTRRYARRQLSWFKRYPEIKWLESLNTQK